MPLSTIDNTGLSQSQILSAINMPTGSVVQVVQGTLTTAISSTNTSTSSPTATGLSVTITPQFSTSKILLRLRSEFFTTNSGYNSYVYLYRGSTYLNPYTGFNFCLIGNGGGQGRYGTYSTEALDSPSTTSPITYNVGISMDSGGGAVWFNSVYYGALQTTYPPVAVLTAMEIR